MTSSRIAAAVLVLLASSSCGSDETTPEVLRWGDGTTETSAPEVFTWGDCAIELSPPPAEWKRQRLQGSLEGVSFLISRVPPGKIDVGYYRLLHRGHSVRSVATGEEQRFEPPPQDFTLDDVVDRVLFDPESLPQPGRVEVQPEVDRTVDGWAAIGLDYTWEYNAQTLLGREVYVVAGEELFVVKVRGSEADLEVFEQVLATIRLHLDSAASE